MVNMELLKQAIDDSGMTMTAIASKSGMNRVTLYNRLHGIGEVTVSEAVGLANTLHLTEDQRNRIFFAEEVV